MRVTLGRIKIRALYETVRVIPLLFNVFWLKVIGAYYDFYIGMMEEYLRNPKIQWKK